MSFKFEILFLKVLLIKSLFSYILLSNKNLILVSKNENLIFSSQIKKSQKK